MKWVVAAAIAAAFIAVPDAHAADRLMAGVGVEDASWHVGAASGQYGSNRDPSGDADPHLHQFRRNPSYGVQSRLEMRAIVVEGPASTDPRKGKSRFALVKTDLYIPQDLLYRRAAQLIKEKGVQGIDRTNLVMAVTHDHSSPFYTTPSWGVWVFQDVFDIRAYEYYAERIARAVKKAADSMKPVRVGGAETQLERVHRNSQGGATANDGSPAGYPYEYTDHTVGVVRFDDISDPAKPKPLAVLVNYSNHPEGLDSNDLISADWIGHMERQVDEATGATTIYTQNAVGHSEMEESRWRPPAERDEYYHRQYAQGERAARITSDAALGAWREVGAGGGRAPFVETGVVDFQDEWFPGPLTHPYPSVANCRTDSIAKNPPDPRIPVANECIETKDGFGQIPWSEMPAPANHPGLVIQQLKGAGIPVPDNYGVPSYTGLQEDIDVHLQGFRIGDIFFPVCSCEQWADQSFNLKARTDKTAGNETQGHNLGYDWSVRCEPLAGGEYRCPQPPHGNSSIVVSQAAYERMKAQVRNDAHGWNSPEYARYAESEPLDPKLIKGNFTHDDNGSSAALGYAMTVPISMANDYQGYIVSYREFQQGDHYRKSLAGWGPHSSDYMTTRLVKLGRLMKGGPDLIESVRKPDGSDAGIAGEIDPDADNVALQAKATADEPFNDVRAEILGRASRTLLAAWEQSIPPEPEPEITRQPKDVQRFDLASVQWRGGSNYTDNPIVKVQRRAGDEWVDEASGSGGKVATTLKMPTLQEVPAYRASQADWLWTAHHEVFSSELESSKPGTYRFVISGTTRAGAYKRTSDAFDVGPWAGIAVDDVRREEDGRVSFRVGPRRFNVEHDDAGFDPEVDPIKVPVELGPIDYPDSYAHRPERARFIRDTRHFTGPAAGVDATRLFCLNCTFRAWSDTGDAVRATVTFARANGQLSRVRARPGGGRWLTERGLRPGESAYVCPGDVEDRFGNINGVLSGSAGAAEVSLRCTEEPVVGKTPPQNDGSSSGSPSTAALDYGVDGIGNVGRLETGAAASLGLPASTVRAARAAGTRRCVARRGLRVRLRAPRRGLRIRSAVVYVNGKRVRTLRGGAARRTITVRRAAGKRTTVVRVRMRTSDGRRYTTTKRYRPC